MVDLSGADLARLHEQVPPGEWIEGGMDHDPPPPVAFGVVEDSVPVAVAVLNLWRQVPSDIGVVVAPSHRGRGLAAHVGGHAASHAVHEHGIARWRATRANVPSTRTAERLGFEPYVTQLAVRPPS